MLATEVPLDSLVREIKRGRNYTLGLGRATPLSNDLSRSWPGRVANSLHDKTGRRTLLVDTEATDSSESSASSNPMSDAASQDLEINQIHWPISRDSARSGPGWNASFLKQLGTLPQWKEEYPLIVLHLGFLDSAAFEMLGKLCDGIALAADMSRSPGTSLRDLSRTLRHHQAHGCRLLGMWSVEIG
jgi:hypothetical protein